MGEEVSPSVDVPPRVEYQLTDFGEELCEILQSLAHWTTALKSRWMDENNKIIG